MNRRLVFSLIALASASCQAAELPIVGLFEQIPVVTNYGRIVARPAYVFTERRLSGSVVFSGLMSGGTDLAGECCFEVKNPVPVVLDDELAKYKLDAEFVAHMNAVKGYRYVYAAQPSTDRRRSTPLVVTLVKSASDPDDGVPFSMPVVVAQFDKAHVPAAFTVGGGPLALQVRFDKKVRRTAYVFTQGGRKIEFSEADFPH